MRRLEIPVGMRFNRLSVIGENEPRINRRNKFAAQVTLSSGKKKYLGSFNTAKEASLAVESFLPGSGK